MTDELEIEQVREAQFHWVNICDDDGEELLTIDFKQNSEGKWVLASIRPGESFAPSYHFSKVGMHTRLSMVKEHCNMIPPDFKSVDPVGITPTYSNEEFRSIGVQHFESDYAWLQSVGDWIPRAFTLKDGEEE
tara:strand:+ start:258 stop:656 length:399 start_codon:yes stop_codon:yes gene_type:complete